MTTTNSAATNNKGGVAKDKTTAKVTPTNGATASPELSKFKVPAPQEQQPGATATVKPIQERINRFYELEKLMERRDSLVEHLEKLGGFTIAPTGGAHMKITDDKGNSFGIAHPIVIGEMVHLAKEKLQAELNSVEAQIII